MLVWREKTDQMAIEYFVTACGRYRVTTSIDGGWKAEYLSRAEYDTTHDWSPLGLYKSKSAAMNRCSQHAEATGWLR